MGNSLGITRNNSKDPNPQSLLVAFQSAGEAIRGVAGRYGVSVTLTAGKEPGHGFFACPVAVHPKDVSGPTTALAAGGPAGKIKGQARAEFRIDNGSGSTVPILCGILGQHAHNLSAGTLSSVVTDDRAILAKYTVHSRMVYDADNNAHYWDNQRTIFNELGWPNMVRYNGRPRFARSHRYGYSSRYDREDFTAPSNGSETGKAGYWTAGDIVEYFRDVHYTRSGSQRPQMSVDIGNFDLPPFIQWPAGLGKSLGYERQIQHFDLTGQSLLDALQACAAHVGWDLFVRPLGGFMSEITFLNFRVNGNNASRLFLPSYGINDIGEAMSASDLIKGGTIVENFLNRSKTVVILGDAPVVERFHSTDGSGTGANYLEPAWPEQDEALYTAYIDSHGRDQTSFNAANEIWPLVFAAFRVKKYADVWASTKWAGTPNIPYPRERSHQLTGFNQDSSSNNPKSWIPREIVVERKFSPQEEDDFYDDPGNSGLQPWEPCYKFDGLTLTPDSQIVMLPVLRENGATWYAVENDDGYEYGSVMRRREIRMNLAIEGNFPIVGKATGDPNNCASRIDPTFDDYVYVIPASALDYVEWLRVPSSRPVGEARIPLNFAIFDFGNNKASAGNELFSDRPGNARNPDPNGRIMRHARIDHENINRVELNGSLIFNGLNPAILPGLCATVEGRDTIPIFGVVKSVTYNVESQETTAEFASSDPMLIVDPPMPANTSSLGSTGSIESDDSSSTGGKTSTTYYPGDTPDDYQTPVTPSTPSEPYREQPSSKPDDYQEKAADPYEQEEASRQASPAAATPGDQASPASTANAPAKQQREPYMGAPRDYAGKDFSQVSEYSGPDYAPRDYKGKDFRKQSEYSGPDFSKAKEYQQPASIRDGANMGTGPSIGTSSPGRSAPKTATVGGQKMDLSGFMTNDPSKAAAKAAARAKAKAAEQEDE